MTQKYSSAVGVAGAFILCLQTGHARASSVNVTVPGMTMPWNYATKLNSRREYGTNDGTSPVVVTLASLSAESGQKLRITYVSGTVCAGGGYPCDDAVGDRNYVTDHNTGSSGTFFPSKFVHKEPTYLCELIGTFTDMNGKLVGPPFAVGDKLSKTIPTGATQLQLGVNDDIFSDNSGSWEISVSPVD